MENASRDFGTRPNDVLAFSALDVPIQDRICSRYVGVYIDKSFKFEEQIRYKISPLVGILVDMRDDISKKSTYVFLRYLD